jgi:hypothetical protein
VTLALAGRVAIIGWGSLLWDPDGLPVQGPWRRGAGPALPLEFSRVSPKRNGALTLAIDPEDGEPCRTAVAASPRATVEAARVDLARREATRGDRIGAACARRGVLAAARPETGAAVAAWVAATGAAGAVWTDLPANFAEATGAAFSIAAALAHLRDLDEAALAGAVRYVACAPVETDTPLRRALATDPWWRGLAAGAR